MARCLALCRIHGYALMARCLQLTMTSSSKSRWRSVLRGQVIGCGRLRNGDERSPQEDVFAVVPAEANLQELSDMWHLVMSLLENG